jgi:hypothetical protein
MACFNLLDSNPTGCMFPRRMTTNLFRGMNSQNDEQDHACDRRFEAVPSHQDFLIAVTQRE